MNYQIRPATLIDLPRILEIYENARQFMRETGNPNQWGDSHPAERVLRDDIAGNQLYVCVDSDSILGVFAYIPGIDPTYLEIFDGNWRNSDPYGVIHRMAVASRNSGVASFCFQWALEQCPNLRIDTHRDNIPMQSALKKNGFSYCGIIYLLSGDPRFAYHKVK